MTTLVGSHEDNRRASCTHVGCTVCSSKSNHTFSLQFTVSDLPLSRYYPAIRQTPDRFDSRHLVETSSLLLTNAQRHGAALLSRGRLADKARLGRSYASRSLLILSTTPVGQRGDAERKTDARGTRERVNWEFCSTEGVCLGGRKSYCARPCVRTYEFVFFPVVMCSWKHNTFLNRRWAFWSSCFGLRSSGASYLYFQPLETPWRPMDMDMDAETAPGRNSPLACHIRKVWVRRIRYPRRSRLETQQPSFYSKYDSLHTR